MPLTYEQHLNAGAIYGEDATCGGITKKKKIDYKSMSTAQKSADAMMRKGSKDLEPYPCYWCEGWHIGRSMTQEEYDVLLRTVQG